jgi:acetyl esterase/lipase
VLRYLATGEEVHVPGVENHPPHDYGVAVILYGLADRGIVPADQVEPLRTGVETYLLASQLTLVDMNQANATFEKARQYTKTLPEPAATYMTYVNDRNVAKLGPALVPYLNVLGADSPALSADRAPSAPTAPVFLLHGSGDTVIPTAESVLLADYLRSKGADVDLLISDLITHAEVDRTAAASESVKLVTFWADVLKQ